MAINTGIGAQLGIAKESTHGDFTAPTDFIEFTQESLSAEIERLESSGLAKGRRQLRSGRWVPAQKTVEGDVSAELATEGLLPFWEAAFGGSSSSGTGPYTHEFTLGDFPPGLTVQVGRPDETGTLQPFSYVGGMVSSFSLEASTGEIASCTFTVNAQDEKTNETLATPSYPDPLRLLTFVGGSLKIAGSEVEVTSASVEGDNGLSTDRWKFGSKLRKRPARGLRAFTGEFEAYFSNLDLYNRYINGDEATLTLTFEGETLSDGSTPAKVEFSALVRFDGSTPQVGGSDEVMQSISYKAVSDSTNPTKLTVVTDETL